MLILSLLICKEDITVSKESILDRLLSTFGIIGTGWDRKPIPKPINPAKIGIMILVAFDIPSSFLVIMPF